MMESISSWKLLEEGGGRLEIIVIISLISGVALGTLTFSIVGFLIGAGVGIIIGLVLFTVLSKRMRRKWTGEKEETEA